MSENAIKKRNHTVPKVYLKEFSYQKGKGHYFFVFDKQTGRIRELNIENAAVEKEFYTLKAVDNPNVWEDFYANQIEPLMHTVLKKIVFAASPLIVAGASILDQKTKYELALIVIYQLYRGRNARKKQISYSEQIIPEVLKNARMEFSHLPEERFEELSKAVVENPEIIKTSLAQVSTDPIRMEGLARYLTNRIWVIFRVDGPKEIITSDNPVIIMDSITGNATPFEIGLSGVNSVLYYPIAPKIIAASYSREYMLGALQDGSIDGKVCLLSSDKDGRLIDIINKAQIKNCSRQTFAHSKNILRQLK